MEERKHQHSTFLCTDALGNLQWVERLPDGRLFSLMEHGKPNGPRCAAPCSQYLFGRISADGGKTWGKPYLLYEWPDPDTAWCVQGWKSDRDGRIHIFASAITVYNYQKNELEGHIAYIRFDSFRGENPLYSDIPTLYRYTGSLNNLIEAESGRLVVPFSTYMDGKFVSNTIFSDDCGVSWRASNDVVITDTETNCESGAVEPVIAEVKPGVLIMLIRTVLNRLWYAVSYDGGESWNAPKPTALPSSNAPATLQKLPDGRIFLAWNDCLGHPMGSVRYSSARQCLHAAISDDGLRTVHGARIIAKKVIGDRNDVHNAYPTTAMANEKEIQLGILFQTTLGHGGYWNLAPQSNIEADKIIKADGTETHRCCPLDQRFLDYIYHCVATLCEERPAFTLGDDDMRMFDNTCYCERHVKMISEMLGKDHTREELAAAIENAAPHDPVQIAFEKAQIKALEKLSETMRKAIDATDPSISCGCCIVRTRYDYAESETKILAGSNEPFLRISNALYLENAAKEEVHRNAATAFQVVNARKWGFKLLDESDTCPHNRYSKTARTMHLHITSGLLEGLDGG